MICPQDMIPTKKCLKYIMDDINISGLIMIGRYLIYHIILDKLILSYSSFNLLL